MKLDKFIVFDKHLNQKGELDYSLVDSPFVIQDATTGEDVLHFSYPVEADLVVTHTLNVYWEQSLGEVNGGDF